MKKLPYISTAATVLLLTAASPASLANDEEEIPFSVANVFFELNNTDGDLGIHALIDGEPWKKLKIEDTRERKMLNIRLTGRSPCSTVNPGARAQGTLWVFSDDAHPAEAAADDTDIVRIAVPDRAGSGNDEATVLLAAALGDWVASVREEAVDVLGDLSGEAAIPLLEQALVDPDSDVQEAAIAALADIGGEQAARALATTLNDDNTALRENTVDALGDIGGKTATRLLQRALADQERLVRDAAAEHLVELLNQQD